MHFLKSKGVSQLLQFTEVNKNTTPIQKKLGSRANGNKNDSTQSFSTHYTLGSLDKLNFMLAHNVVGNNYFSEHPYVCYIM